MSEEKIDWVFPKQPTFLHNLIHEVAVERVPEAKASGNQEAIKEWSEMLLKLGEYLVQVNAVTDEQLSSIVRTSPNMPEHRILGIAPREIQAMMFLRHQAGIRAAFPIAFPINLDSMMGDSITPSKLAAFEDILAPAFKSSKEDFNNWSMWVTTSVMHYFGKHVENPQLGEGGVLAAGW